METFLVMAAIYLLAATVCVPLAVRFGLGSVLGYLVAGVLIGPITGLVGSETADLQHFAEFGVVMMLFLIGLELDPKTLWDMRARLVGMGGGQVILTMAAIGGIAFALGQPIAGAVAAGAIFALSSTAIVMQTLQEKGLQYTTGGRGAFSVLLAQDIAVIPMLAILPFFATGAVGGGHGDAHGEEAIGDGASAQMAETVGHMIETLPGWGVGVLTIGAVAAVILGGRFLTQPIFTYVGRARMREMLTIVSLLFVVGVAALMMLVGLSPALGTFLAGVVLANSEYRHELEADIEPFKGLLLGLFFITVGAGINFGVLFGAPLMVLALVVGVIAIKAAVLFLIATLFRLKGRDRVLFTLSLAQAGEFGFILVSLALAQGLIGGDLGAIFLLVIALSMLLTPILFITYDAYAARSPSVAPIAEADDIDARGQVIIAGVGRFGQVVQRMLQGAGVQGVVLDHDIETINLMRSFGLKTYMGDPTRPQLLEAAGIEQARILVVAVDGRPDAVRVVEVARKLNPDIHIIARAYDRVHVYELYRAGADQIVREMFDSSLRVGRYTLEKLGWSDTEAYRARDDFFRHDRHVMLELAKLWKPGVPVSENAAYVARAREYAKDLENALLTRFGEDEKVVEELSGDPAPPERLENRTDFSAKNRGDYSDE